MFSENDEEINENGKGDAGDAVAAPSPEAETYLEAATAGDDALVKVCGLGNMRLAMVLDDLCTLLSEKGSRQLALDLTDCSGMDSTFMGTLVSISANYAELGGWMCLVNVSAANRNLLEMLGVAKLVQTRESFPIDPLKVARLHLPPTDDAARRLALIKKAHERLVAIDERNLEKFGAFLKMLGASLATGSNENNNQEEKHAE